MSSIGENSLVLRLSKDNRIDFEKLARVERQMAELEKAGAASRSVRAVTTPLGKPASAAATGIQSKSSTTSQSGR
jgi:hypothetical protein